METIVLVVSDGAPIEARSKIDRLVGGVELRRGRKHPSVNGMAASILREAEQISPEPA